MNDYSQFREQKIILDYFGDFRGAQLSCGENDGETLSNARALALLGWHSFLVEPAPIAFSKLRELYCFAGSGGDGSVLNLARVDYSGRRQEVVLVNAAITLQDGPIDFYSSGTHLKKGDTDLLSTTRPEEIERWKKSGEVFTKTTVRGMTFTTLLAETGATHFDFISVDCEGADWDVVQQIDLTAVGCRMLCVEANQSSHRQKFVDYAAKHGMKLHWKSWENLIFCK